MQTVILKAVDSFLGRIVCTFFRRQPPGQIVGLSSVLFIRPGGIGDAILLIPIIKTFKKAFPACAIDILAEKRNSHAFHLIPGIRSVLLYDTIAGFSAVLFNRYNVVIDTEQWYRLSAIVARLVSSPVKIGFDTNERRRMFTHVIWYDRRAYETDNFFNLMTPLTAYCREGGEAVSLKLPLQSVSKARLLLQPLGTDDYIVIFPGASIPEKRWSVKRFGEAAKKLVKNGYKIVVVGGREDRSAGEAIAGSGGLNLASLTTLAETAAVIARSCLVISGDSGVLHIAAGLDIPTISLFGPSCATKWAPRGEKHIVLNRQLDCSPCTRFGTTPPCTHGVRCMDEITAAQVLEAAVRLLRKK
jgi:ADP-heptose:LPS heptosyltransferase